ncbi:uncharacterized protein LOC130933968 [Arachis stenosperma]|uniref:uncharacterized protein LOC130933968 n=1 Tax=Arachis stenosperma TaxID=217475 RepID=UPI0025AC1B2D|nr:uncharacterized protein LOC130933968 [Arachis stenosperma]
MEEKLDQRSGPEGGIPTMDAQQFAAFFSQIAKIQSHINKTNPNQDLSSSYYILLSENPSIPITNVTLTGFNYSAWSKAMIIVLYSKNKFEFVDDSIIKPKKTDPIFKVWKICNIYVVAWINLSLSPNIYQSVLWNNVGYKLWNDLKHRYYQGIVRLQREKDRVTKFFRGLGEQYSTVKSQVMLMARIILSNMGKVWKNQSTKGQNHNKLQCIHCGKTGHTSDNCYKKHRYPPNSKPRYEKKNSVMNFLTTDNAEDDSDNLSD